MTRRQHMIILLLFLLLSSAAISFALTGSVMGQATIPTRTPTPRPGNPTDPPPTDDGGGGGGGNNTPQPSRTPGGGNNTPQPTDVPGGGSSATPASNLTNTPIPSVGTAAASGTPLPIGAATEVGNAATQTAVSMLAASATPFGGVIAPGTTPITFPVVATAFPTAEPCGEPPTFTTLITALVYTGPGNEYDFIQTIGADETRPIVGKAMYDSWWLIQLDAKFTQAWINDRTGVVQGNTANLPEVAAPAVGGVNPTPGTPWEPTPEFDCALTPTATPTSSDPAVIGGSNSETIAESGEEDGSIVQIGSENDQRDIAAATAAPLDIPESSPTPNLLPIVGLVLIIAAVFVALFLRRNPGGGEPSS